MTRKFCASKDRKVYWVPFCFLYIYTGKPEEYISLPSKGILDPAKSSSRVLFKKIAKADHLPCLLTLDVLEKKVHPPKYIFSQKIDDESLAKFRLDLVQANIVNNIDSSCQGDPEQTYETIREIIGEAYKNNFPRIKKTVQAT